MSDFDPTTNRIQFGMLTDEEQKAMKSWPHGWECHSLRHWHEIDGTEFYGGVIYRGKPAPVVTSTWFNVYPYGPSRADNSTRKSADENCSPHRIAVLRIDTCNGVQAHLEEV
jgi:hypothetical protein